jgi:predicted patatin/cPLA2 family phospholipase
VTIIGVRELVWQRAAQHSQPGARRDGHRLALCIEGGAMRGVVSAGMVVALEHLGLLPVFDRIYGSSGGAINAAYFIAGQAAFGTTIYYENINNQRFIDLKRPLRRRPIVDLDFLVWNVMRGSKILDWSRVVSSKIPLRVVATDTASADRATFREWSDGEDLLRCLRAGASMPIVAGEPYAYRGGTYWDALLCEPIPVRIAEEEGCTHLLVLLTRPHGSGGPRLSLVDRLVVVPRLRKISKPLGRRYEERSRHYVELLDVLKGGRGPHGALALTIAPEGPAVGKLERSRAKLVAGARDGMQAVFKGLDCDPTAAHEALTVFDRGRAATDAEADSRTTRDDRRVVRTQL